MDNNSVVAIYIPFIVGTVLILISLIGKNLSRQALLDYLFFCVSLLGWQVTECLFYVFDQPGLMEFDYNIKLVFIALCGVFIFRVFVGFYKLDKMIPKWITYAIFVIPAITAVICFTGFSSDLLRTGFEVTSTDPLNKASFGDGIWYDVNSIFTNIMAVSAGIIVLIMHYRLPKAYRYSTVSFMFALLFYAGGYAVSIITGGPVDFIMLGCGLSNLAIFFVVARSYSGDYLSIARREIFNYLDVAVFILDEKDRIVDVNIAGKEWLRLMSKESIYISFLKMIESLENEGLVETSGDRDDDSLIIKLTGTDILMVYEVHEQALLSEKGDVLGKFVTLEDVTRNSLFIDRLEIDAGMDPLTGLQNRYTYEELLVELNKEENLPISVILGDVNSLKFINDNYGHMAGDALLSAAGDVIKKCCPANGYAARIGGDEFVIMVPNCNEDEIAMISDDIRSHLDKIEDLSFDVTMALGSVTKTALEGTLKSHVNEADKIMYKNKTTTKENESD